MLNMEHVCYRYNVVLCIVAEFFSRFCKDNVRRVGLWRVSAELNMGDVGIPLIRNRRRDSLIKNKLSSLNRLSHYRTPNQWCSLFLLFLLLWYCIQQHKQYLHRDAGTLWMPIGRFTKYASPVILVYYPHH